MDFFLNMTVHALQAGGCHNAGITTLASQVTLARLAVAGCADRGRRTANKMVALGPGNQPIVAVRLFHMAFGAGGMAGRAGGGSFRPLLLSQQAHQGGLVAFESAMKGSEVGCNGLPMALPAGAVDPRSIGGVPRLSGGRAMGEAFITIFPVAGDAFDCAVPILGELARVHIDVPPSGALTP
jgi:hypothetical protein